MAQVMDIQETYQLGFELRCSGRYAEAKEHFKKILQRNPRHVDSKWQLGLIEGFEGDFEGSLSTLAELSKEFPDHEGVRYDLAMTQMMLGMTEEACNNFRLILEKNPNHENAKRQIKFCGC